VDSANRSGVALFAGGVSLVLNLLAAIAGMGGAGSLAGGMADSAGSAG